MRHTLASLALLLLSLPAAGQALAPAPGSRAPAGPGYGAFTPAPTPGQGPATLTPADQAGALSDPGGPVNSTPFSSGPTGQNGREGGQISPALRDTSPGDRVLPSLSR